MEKGKREKRVLSGAAELFDLPADLVAGLIHLEVLGNQQLYMENHRGILAYGTQEIHISGGVFSVKVCGEGLELRTMNALELLITGQILQISIV